MCASYAMQSPARGASLASSSNSSERKPNLPDDCTPAHCARTACPALSVSYCLLTMCVIYYNNRVHVVHTLKKSISVQSRTSRRHRAPEWLLLVYQLPAKPSNIRVRTWRRLLQVGAVGVKILPFLMSFTPSTSAESPSAAAILRLCHCSNAWASPPPRALPATSIRNHLT